MFVKIAAAGTPALEDTGNFKAFKVVSEIPLEQATPILASIGRIDGDHVWLDAGWLTKHGPDDAGWQVGFTKMVDYAKTAGWVDETGAIRAHIEIS